MTSPATPWKEKPLSVFLMLLFFWPVGLYYLWRSPRIAKGWKVGVTLLIGLSTTALLLTPAPPRPARAVEPTVTDSPPAPLKEQVISSPALAARYAENEVKADQDFKGRYLLVSGEVTGIKKDMFDKIYVTLATSNEFMPTRCDLNDEDVAASLQIGQQVLVKGKCEGSSLGIVSLNDCKLIKQ